MLTIPRWLRCRRCWCKMFARVKVCEVCQAKPVNHQSPSVYSALLHSTNDERPLIEWAAKTGRVLQVAEVGA